MGGWGDGELGRGIGVGVEGGDGGWVGGGGGWGWGRLRRVNITHSTVVPFIGSYTVLLP